MTPAPLRIRTLAQLRAVLEDRSGLVITDTASDRVFHPDPSGCTHVREERFVTKIVENAERNGSYFAVASFSDARETWPGIARCRSAACSTAVEAATREVDPGEEDERLRRVLGEATGSEVRPRKDPPTGVEALIDEWSTTQRVALGKDQGELVICSWPAELKGQAEAVYGSDIAHAIVGLVDSAEGWTGRPIPHLAFNGARRSDRFYLPCPLDLSEYVARWSRPQNLREVREHPAEEVRSDLWPWLCSEGFADADDPESQASLDRYMDALTRRRSGAHIRPGIFLRRRCDTSSDEALLRDVRAAVKELATVLGEHLHQTPGPPGSTASASPS